MRQNRRNRTSLLPIALACSLALNAVLLLTRSPQNEIDTSADGAGIEDIAAANDAIALAAPEAVAAKPSAAEAAEVQVSTPTALPGNNARDSDWEVLNGAVQHSLARTFQQLADDDGDALASTFSRLFVWDVNMTRDLQAGDPVAVVWRKRPDGLPEIAAASLQSSKLGRTLTSYRWQAPGDLFASDWRLDGSEVPLRLKEGPITGYEQITSLLKDRPTHKGMDFKTPVGTEVTSPRAGKVTRSNWNWRANGNCIEVRYDDGVLAKFLHLNENRVKPGERVSAGQVIALSGNTGHSTAPHLHYQLDRGRKTLDPLDYHGTTRRTLSEDQVAAMRLAVGDFKAMIEESGAVAQGIPPS